MDGMWRCRYYAVVMRGNDDYWDYDDDEDVCMFEQNTGGSGVVGR
jgi:hypothetical protein